MPTNLNLSDFKSAVVKKGYLTPNRFLVTIPSLPNGVLQSSGSSSNFGSLTNSLQFYIDTCNLPGVQINTSDNYRYGYGVVVKRPTGLTFADITTSAHSDSEGQVLKFFQNWMKVIMNYDNRTGDLNAQTGLIRGQVPYEIAYKSDYAVDMTITVFNQAGDAVVEVDLHDAYPIFLNDIGLSWAENSSIMRIPVTFTYKSWNTKDLYVGGANIRTSTAPRQAPTSVAGYSTTSGSSRF
jgi:hypothetical protein